MALDLTVTHLSGSKKGTVETVRGNPVKLGRAEGNHVRFDPEVDRKVSGNHAEVREAAGRVSLHDLESRNGVLVNGATVEGSCDLPNRSEIQLGKDGPRIRIDYEAASGGIDFKRVRNDTRRKLDRDKVLAAPSLLSTDESLTAYTPEELGLSKREGGEKELPIVPIVLGAAGLLGLIVAYLLFM